MWLRRNRSSIFGRGSGLERVLALCPRRLQFCSRSHRRRSCASTAIPTPSPAFERSSKRRNSFPSETHVKRGHRYVHGDVELIEKLGRNDLCPCGSGSRFQGLLPEVWPL
ncbi:MAG: SEC-C metal-binding domain-containing protein [Alphaproteobacteria bacterium]|nr:SEC-C metal-binding domain-containing protein [Alphaproteobacteria bacterium]